MKKFIIEMLSGKSGISAKRVSGFIGFMCFIVFVAIWRRDLVESIGVLSASLIGLDSVTKIFKKQK